MPRCNAIKRDGERCKADAMPGAEWCYSHHPEHAEERRRRASRGGRSGGRGRPSELRAIKALCEDLTERVLVGETPPGLAAVANQLINTRLRAVEQERKVRETEELEERIEALERATDEASGGGRRWEA